MKTEIDIAGLREKIAKASPMPWFYDSYSHIQSAPLLKAMDDDPTGETDCDVCQTEVAAGDTATKRGQADAEAIEAGMNALPAILDELESKQVRIVALEEQVARLPDGWKRRAETAEARVKESEAKLAKVREWAESEIGSGASTLPGSPVGLVLAILDGKGEGGE